MNDWKDPGLQDLKEAPSGVKTQRRSLVCSRNRERACERKADAG